MHDLNIIFVHLRFLIGSKISFSVTSVVEFCGRESTGAWWILFYLTFKVNFLCQKSFESFFSLKNISLEEGFLFLKWCIIFDGPSEHLWKSNQKNIFILLIFLLKSTACWLTSAKLHHWGHTNKFHASYQILNQLETLNLWSICLNDWSRDKLGILQEF